MRTVLLFLHLISVIFWVGGIFVNTVVLMPSLQAISPAERGKMMGAFLKRFAPLAWGSVVLVAITGLFLINNVISFPALVSFGTRYGNLLLAKIILVTVMILNGAYVGLVLGPRLASFAPPPGAPKPANPGQGERPPGPPPELLKLQGRIATLNWVQVALAVVVLFLMGLL